MSFVPCSSSSSRGLQDVNKGTKGQESFLKLHCSIDKLDPLVDKDGVLCVSDLLKHANLHDRLNQPVILPKGSLVTNLVITYHHVKICHQGKEKLLDEIPVPLEARPW